MKRSLARVLRVKLLLEELSREELRKQAGERNRLLQAAEWQRQSCLTARGDGLRRMEEGDSGWRVETVDAELLSGQHSRLLALAEERRPAVEAARELMLARRVERLQVETLAAHAATKAEEEGRRREQRLLDDCVQSRRFRSGAGEGG